MNKIQSIGISLMVIGLALTIHEFGWLLGMLVIGIGSGFLISGAGD